MNLDDAEYVRHTLGFAGCQMLLRVDRQLSTDEGQVVSHDTRYFVTSLDPGAVAAERLLEYVRGHWQIENRLHFVKDRWWDEDRHATRRPGLSACLAALNNAALSIHRLRSDPNLPLRASADHVAWRPTRGLELLQS